ncbi:hypothetical protein H0H92_001053, partial [Tricholoma furcatifolium]
SRMPTRRSALRSYWRVHPTTNRAARLIPTSTSSRSWCDAPTSPSPPSLSSDSVGDLTSRFAAVSTVWSKAALATTTSIAGSPSRASSIRTPTLTGSSSRRTPPGFVLPFLPPPLPSRQFAGCLLRHRCRLSRLPSVHRLPPSPLPSSLWECPWTSTLLAVRGLSPPLSVVAAASLVIGLVTAQMAST